MKYLPNNLKHEYNYLVDNYEDIPELSHPLINMSDVFRAYFILAHFFTDSSSTDQVESILVGLRSDHLLASALGRQNTSCKPPKLLAKIII